MSKLEKLLEKMRNPLDLINLHRPHPGNEVKAYVIRQVREKLKNGGML